MFSKMAAMLCTHDFYQYTNNEYNLMKQLANNTM